MAKRPVRKVKPAPTTQNPDRPKLVFRYKDEQHQVAVSKAAQLAGLSVNAWIVQETLKAARKQLRAEEDEKD